MTADDRKTRPFSRAEIKLKIEWKQFNYHLALGQLQPTQELTG